MTIKFNFYDIYGFALPGFLLLAVLWLPFGLIDRIWPDAQFSSALLGVILAYFVGHILQTVAHTVIPSRVIRGRFPSIVFLDEDDTTFSREFKQRLAQQIKSAFGLDVCYAAWHEVPREHLEKVRGDAFFLCRSALIKNKTILYAEQFEGLYALMRGLSAAFGLGVAYYLGWAASGLFRPIKTFSLVPPSWWSGQGSGLIFLAGIILAIVALINADIKWFKKYAKPLMIASLLLAAFATGYHLGLSRPGTSEHRGQLIAAAVFSFFAAERCYTGYKAFAQEFAKAVYRDFYNFEKPPAGQKPNGEEDDAGA